MSDTFLYRGRLHRSVLSGLLPELTPEQYLDLDASIGEHGWLTLPVVDLSTDPVEVLDGVQRLRLAEARGETVELVDVAGMTTEQKLRAAVRLNTSGRHLTVEQRAEMVGWLHEEGWSGRVIAGMVGVDEKTVRNDRGRSTADNSAVETRTGADGKERPSIASTSTALAERRAEAEHLHARGLTVAAIAERLHCSTGTVSSDLSAARVVEVAALSDAGGTVAEIAQAVRASECTVRDDLELIGLKREVAAAEAKAKLWRVRDFLKGKYEHKVGPNTDVWCRCGKKQSFGSLSFQKPAA